MNIKSEHLLGLVDGVYAIALTLFALDLNKDLTVLLQYESGKAAALFEYGLLYIATFFLIFDMWLVHKSVLVSKEKQPIRNSEILTVLTLLIVTTIPGLALQSLDVFIESKGGVQSQMLAPYHLLMLGIYAGGYACLALVERSHGVRHTRNNVFGYSFGRALIFGIAFIASTFTYFIWSGYVVSVPVIVLVMLISGMALRHGERV